MTTNAVLMLTLFFGPLAALWGLYALVRLLGLVGRGQ